ncbi:LPXTG-motif cell wall anchor domain protein [Aeromicrobium marinum DSM 15272]|uniref:LPXTG-motif cell wall anchor domain protein n=1 Tax=Aeromicrobium marinum DSM 15272 TaxID=585531 RepID=E2S9D6_9ACTN|nr:hypothetical protein [Aeromicrobium marinum]EFQ83860.1 LPXTG-motif cell wall anchor domain protein [Aeromicrobium marinum DSM 15272]
MIRSTTTVVLALVLALLVSSPAAADPRIGLSNDGVTFGQGLAQPLYDPEVRWVPGDTRGSSFFVRNQAGEAAFLSIDVLGSEVDSLLETGDLTISARGADGPWRDISTTGTQRLVEDLGISSGQVTRVDVEVSFAPESVNQSQTKQLELDFRVRLTQDPNGVVDIDDGVLPGTGGAPLPALIIGLALLGGGIIATSRRRQEENDHV